MVIRILTSVNENSCIYNEKSRRPGNDSAAPISAGCGSDFRLVTLPYTRLIKIPFASAPLQICDSLRLDQSYRSILLFIHTVFIRGGFITTRESDIQAAFMGSLALDGRGRQTLTTAAFQKRLDDLNHVWTLAECNRWIRRYQNFFFELVTEENENKTWALRNMGYVR